MFCRKDYTWTMETTKGQVKGLSEAIIIPAYNEAATIIPLIHSLCANDELQGVTVIVVCNGCTDDTAERARAAAAQVAHPPRIIETQEGWKIGAIRLAEESLEPGPRLYLDADVDISARAARQLLDAVHETGTDIAVPTRHLDLGDVRSYLARAYHRTWAALPWVRAQLAGRGAYALSQSLRARFGVFPDVIADDRWATTRAPRERATIVPATVSVRPAESLDAILAARTRIYLGNNDDSVPTHDASRSERVAGLVNLAKQPEHAVGLAVFFAVNSLAKWRARRDAAGGQVTWDVSSSQQQIDRDPAETTRH